MNDAWIKNLNEFKEFVAARPEIQIEPTMVSIPGEVRPEFYRLFDAVRKGYLQANFPQELADAGELSPRFAEVQQETIRRLNLKRIDFDSGTKSFLNDPPTGLITGLFDPLFDLLKGRIDAANFDQIASRSIKNAFTRLFHNGYEYWAALSLICLSEPDNAFIVPVHDQSLDPEILSADARPGGVEEVPGVVTAEIINLDVSRVTPFLSPNVIIHSALMQAFVACGVDPRDVFRGARVLSKNFEWIKKDSLHSRYGRHFPSPDIELNLRDDSNDLRVLADWQVMARPDISINVMESTDWYTSGKLDLVKIHNKTLKPVLGSWVLCRGPVPEAAIVELQSESEAERDLIAKQIEAGTPPEKMQEASQPIYLLEVGYDRSKLALVTNALAKSRKSA